MPTMFQSTRPGRSATAPSADLLIPTLEFNNEAAGVIRLAQSFNDVTATTELAETVIL